MCSYYKKDYNTVNCTTGCGMTVKHFPLLCYCFQLHSQSYSQHKKKTYQRNIIQLAVIRWHWFES